MAVQDPNSSYPVGLVDFRVQCANPGDSANVTIYYTKQYDTSSWIYKKFDSLGNAYSDISGLVTFGTANVGGTTVTTVSYTVTDGDAQTDEDGVANSVIDDPAGPAVPVASSIGGGGGAPTNHVVYMCTSETGKCENIFPTKGNNPEAYKAYRDCYRKGSGTGIECATAWARSKNYVTFDEFNKQNITKDESSFLSSAKTEEAVEQEIAQENTENKCSIQLARYPEKRGTGLPIGFFQDANTKDRTYKYAVDLAEQDIIHGDDDTHNARLDDKITRAEIAKLVSQAAAHKIKTGTCLENTFKDVEYGVWYQSYIENLREKNVVSGYGNDLYKPSNNINKVEFIKIVAITFDFITREEADRMIYNTDKSWYEPYVEVLKQKGVYPDWFTNIKSGENLTRGDVFSLLSNVLKVVDRR